MVYVPEQRGFRVFDARDLADGVVASWTDAGGRNTVAQGTGANQPSKGGGVVAFDGATDIITDTARGLGTPTATNLQTAWNAYAGTDSLEFVPTGITEAPDGTWWIVNGAVNVRPDTILVHFSADFSSVLAHINLGTVYGTGVIGTTQGIVYDTDDDTLWFTSALVDEVKHITTAGVDISADAISVSNPNGLAIDQANGHLIILESPSTAANGNAGVIETYNKTTKALVDSGTLTTQTDWDHLYFDQDSRALFITSGTNGSACFVGIYRLDGPTYLEQVSNIITLPDCQAIEGISYRDGVLSVANNDLFHNSVGQNEILQYACGPIVGSRILFGIVMQVGSNSSTDVVASLGYGVGGTSEYGHSILIGGDTDIRLFNRSSTTDLTNATFNTDTPSLSASKRIVTGWFNPADANDCRMWIDGTELTGSVTGGANDAFTGPVTDRVNLAIGAGLDGATQDRHSDVDFDAFAYGLFAGSAADERQELEGWLAHEFALTGSLPGGHPYKTTPPSGPPLNALTLTSATVEEGAAQGTVIGEIEGRTAGSTLSLTNNDGGRFQLNGTTIEAGPTAIDFAEGTPRTIAVQEALTGAANTPNVTNLNIEVTPAAGASTFPGDWTRRAAITVGTVTGTHANFPVLLNATQLATALAEAQNGGGDLRFSSDEAGTTQLACDVVEFDTVGSTAQVWVKVPSVSTGTVIYAWWGTPNSDSQPDVTDTFGSQAVWADFAFKYGLDDDSGNWIDSTGNSTANNVGTGAAAQVGNGASLNGTSEFITTTASGITGTAARTFSIWLRTSSAATQFALYYGAQTGGTNGASWRLSVEGGDLWMRVYGGAAQWVATLADDAWHMVTLKHPAGATLGDVEAVIDGVSQGSTAETRALDTTPGTDPDFTPVLLGANFQNGSAGDFWNGLIDEAYMVAGERSNDWLATEYANQSNPATFSTAGTAEDVGGGGGGGGVEGALFYRETGEDAASFAASSVSSGALVARDIGQDTGAFTGAVALSGALIASEVGADAVSLLGSTSIAGALHVQETGQDAALYVPAGAVAGVTGSFFHRETGEDAASFVGRVGVSGDLSGDDAGQDTLWLSGAVAVSGGFAIRESGADATIPPSGPAPVETLTFEKAIVSRLMGSLAVTNLAGDNIEWDELAPDTGLPAVTLQQITDPRPQNHDGFDAFRATRVQVNALAKTKVEAAALREALIAALVPAGSAGSVRFLRSFVDNGGSDSLATKSGRINRAHADLIVWHNTPSG